MGPCCKRPGCRWPTHTDGLCLHCYRLALYVGREPTGFVREPRLDADVRALASDLAASDEGVA